MVIWDSFGDPYTSLHSPTHGLTSPPLFHSGAGGMMGRPWDAPPPSHQTTGMAGKCVVHPVGAVNLSPSPSKGRWKGEERQGCSRPNRPIKAKPPPCQVPDVTTTDTKPDIHHECIPVGIAVATQRREQHLFTSTIGVGGGEERCGGGGGGGGCVPAAPWPHPSSAWTTQPHLPYPHPAGVESLQGVTQLHRDPHTGQFILVPSTNIIESRGTVVWGGPPPVHMMVPPAPLVVAPDPRHNRHHSHPLTGVMVCGGGEKGGSGGGSVVVPTGGSQHLLLSTSAAALVEQSLGTSVVVSQLGDGLPSLGPPSHLVPLDSFPHPPPHLYNPALFITHTETNSFLRSDINTVLPMNGGNVIVKEEIKPELSEHKHIHVDQCVWREEVSQAEGSKQDASNQTELVGVGPGAHQPPVPPPTLHVKQEFQDQPPPPSPIPQPQEVGEEMVSCVKEEGGEPDLSGLELLSNSIAELERERVTSRESPGVEGWQERLAPHDSPPRLLGGLDLLCELAHQRLTEEQASTAARSSPPMNESKRKKEELGEKVKEEVECEVRSRKRRGRPKKKPSPEEFGGGWSPPVLEVWSQSEARSSATVGLPPPPLSPHKRRLSPLLSLEEGSSSSKKRKVGRPRKRDDTPDQTETIVGKPSVSSKIVGLLLGGSTPRPEPSPPSHRVRPKLKAEPKMKLYTDDEDDLGPLKLEPALSPKLEECDKKKLFGVRREAVLERRRWTPGMSAGRPSVSSRVSLESKESPRKQLTASRESLSCASSPAKTLALFSLSPDITDKKTEEEKGSVGRRGKSENNGLLDLKMERTGVTKENKKEGGKEEPSERFRVLKRIKEERSDRTSTPFLSKVKTVSSPDRSSSHFQARVKARTSPERSSTPIQPRLKSHNSPDRTSSPVLPKAKLQTSLDRTSSHIQPKAKARTSPDRNSTPIQPKFKSHESLVGTSSPVQPKTKTLTSPDRSSTAIQPRFKSRESPVRTSSPIQSKAKSRTSPVRTSSPTQPGAKSQSSPDRATTSIQPKIRSQRSPDRSAVQPKVNNQSSPTRTSTPTQPRAKSQSSPDRCSTPNQPRAKRQSSPDRCSTPNQPRAKRQSSPDRCSTPNQPRAKRPTSPDRCSTPNQPRAKSQSSPDRCSTPTQPRAKRQSSPDRCNTPNQSRAKGPSTPDSKDVKVVSAAKSAASRLSNRGGSKVPDCTVGEADLSGLPKRVLYSMGGYLYSGLLSVISSGEIYSVTLDKERGQRPHILAKEQVFTETMLEVGCEGLLLEVGTRVCAYWSQQYNCLYPGTVYETATSTETDVSVEFDDGDNGTIRRQDVRLLPSSYPITDCDPDPVHGIGPRKRNSSTSTDHRSAPPHPRDSSCDAKLSDGHSDNIKLKGKNKVEEEEKENENRNEDYKKTKNDDDAERKRLKKKKLIEMKKKKELKKLLNEQVWEGLKRYKMNFKRRHMREGKRKHKKHRRHDHKHSRTADGDERTRGGKEEDVCESKGDNERLEVAAVVKEPASVVMKSRTVPGTPRETVATTPRETKKVKVNKEKEKEEREKKKEREREKMKEKEREREKEKEKEEKEREKEKEREREKEEKEKREKEKEKGKEEKEKVKEKMKGRRGGGSKKLWEWEGEGVRKGKAGGAGRKKTFYTGIRRANQLIKVGDCAVFVSSAGRADRPYIGRIKSLWEWGGDHMRVRISWFYHPEETTGCSIRLPHPGGLFESDHEDTNDVQTICHRCDVIDPTEFAKKVASSPSLLSSIYKDNTLFYLAGTYHPTHRTISVLPAVKLT